MLLEGAGEPPLGRHLVMSSITTRAAIKAIKEGAGPEKVDELIVETVLQPRQYDCWTGANKHRLIDRWVKYKVKDKKSAVWAYSLAKKHLAALTAALLWYQYTGNKEDVWEKLIQYKVFPITNYHTIDSCPYWCPKCGQKIMTHDMDLVIQVGHHKYYQDRYALKNAGYTGEIKW
jgi:hypothetical protein